MPTICFHIPSSDYFTGGAVNGAVAQASVLAQEFARQHWNVHLVLPGECRIDDERYTVRCYRKTRYINYAEVFKIARTMRRGNADYYYSRGRAVAAAAAVMAAKLSGGKSIWASTGEEGCRKYHNIKRFLRNHPPGVRRLLLCIAAWPLDLIIHWGIRNSDVILCQTEKQKSDLRQFYRKEGVVLKSGHVLPDIRRDRNVEPVTVLYASHLSKVKRPWLFVDMANQLRGHNIRFRMIGRAHKNIADTMDDITGSNVEYLGEVSFGESVRHISEASIVVNTSEPAGEGLSNVFVLAWLHGIPVVSLESDPDGIIRSQGLGCISGSYARMVEDVLRLASNSVEREELGRKARKYARENYDVPIIVDQIVRLIQQESATHGASKEKTLKQKNGTDDAA